MECKKCMYFLKMENTLKKGNVIVGMCKLRKRYITDQSISKEQCKDKAIFAG